MPVTVTKEDLLPHIAYQEAPDAASPTTGAPANLNERVAIPNAQITIISAFGCSLVLNWQFSGSGLDVTLVLDTPVGNATLGQATINPSNPTVTIGGSVGSFKAQATISFDFGTNVLTVSAQVCAPFLGCKSAQTSINL